MSISKLFMLIKKHSFIKIRSLQFTDVIFNKRLLVFYFFIQKQTA